MDKSLTNSQETTSTSTETKSSTKTSYQGEKNQHKENFISKEIYFKKKETSFSESSTEAQENPLLSYYCSNYYEEEQELSMKIPNRNIITSINFVVHLDEEKKPFINKSKKPNKRMQMNVDLLAEQIKTQSGCWCNQKRLETNPNLSNILFYPLLKPRMLELVNDNFGNYFYQQLVNNLNEINLNDFLDFVSLHFQVISFSPFGTRVIQKLLERMSTFGQNQKKMFSKVYREIRGKVEAMSNNENANHVIQKIISLGSSYHTDFIYDEICNSIFSIGKTKFGCCVVQRCIANGTPAQKQRISSLILANISLFVSDQFGNYIVQGLISNCESWFTLTLFEVISSAAVSLCKAKYSSNVIEKIFEIENQQIIDNIANRILKYESDIYELICNPYGNYIIQKILLMTNDELLKRKIFYIIRKNVNHIKSISFGKKFLSKVQLEFPLYSVNISYLK